MSPQPSDPHLVIDVRPLTRQRDGTSTYILELVPRLLLLASEWKRTLIVSKDLVDLIRDWDCGVALNESRPMRLSQHITIPRLCRRLRPDVFFYPAHDPPLLSVGAPLVMTVQDVNPFLVQPYFESWDKAKRAYLRTILGVNLNRAERVIAASMSTKDAIGRVFGKVAMEKTSVVHHAVSHVPSRVTGANRHFLYLGTDRPHKNIFRLIEGYAIASKGASPIPPLVLAGGLRNPAKVRSAVAQAGISDAVRITGHLTDEAVDEFMCDAIALVMPSLAEGFGFPILEAMQRGLPVITSDRSSCIEIAADAALTFDPLDPEAIASALIHVTADHELRGRLSHLGRERAAHFSWDVTAGATLEVIQKALRLGSRSSTAV